MNMVLRVGHYIPGVKIMTYPPAWHAMLPDLGLQHNDIYKIGCDFFRKKISGEDENITALIDAHVLAESGEDVTSVMEKNRESVKALFAHVEKRAPKRLCRQPSLEPGGVVSLPEDDYFGAGR